ncbi:MAG: ABC transporter ATP-binding protein [Opitutales bacterium]|nr:ABC transporter ATP-binding protein [Opitutales bacterium]
MSEAAGIEINAASLRYEDGPPVVGGLDLKVPAGRFHSVIGPSGCGKSTLLRIVAGLLQCQDGLVRVAGSDPCAERGRGTGFVFQDHTLLPWLNVQDNIALPLRLRGVPQEQRLRRAAELATALDLGEYLHYYPRQLSGGMRMRSSLARALSTAPGLMLFDEPFAGLDAIRRDKLGEDILGVWARQGWTALFVTHNVAEAVFLAEKVHVMGGRPACISASFEVPFAYPRKPSIRTSAPFQSLVAKISLALGKVALP